MESRLELVVDSRAAERHLQRLDSHLRQVDGRGNAAAAAMGKFNLAIGAISAAAGGLGFARVIRDFANFEDTMLGLQAVSGATTKQMEDLEKQARSLGATTRYSAQQAGEAQRFFAQAGFDTNEILAATPGILQLATAGQLDLARAADIASNALGQFQLPVTELARVNDVLATAAASANTNVEMIATSFRQVAPIASLAGASLEETAAIVSVLGDSAIQGEQAGTGFRSLLSSLAKPSAAAVAVLSKYGLTLDDVNVKTQGLSTVMERIVPITKDSTDNFTVFGQEAATVSGIIGNSIPRYKELTGELESSAGAANAMAEIIGSGLSNSILTFNSGVSESILKIGEGGLGSAFGSLLDNTSGVLAVYNDMLPAFAEANGLSETQIDRIQALAKGVDMLKDAAALAAGVLSARMVSALAAGTAAQISNFNATRAHTAALAENQAMQAAQTSNTARLAAAEKSAAASRATIAAQRAAQTTAEMAQEVQRVQTLQATLAAERTLAAQRLQSQTTAVGRMQVQGRIVQLQAAEAAAANQLTAASGRLTQAQLAETAAKRAAGIASLEKTRADAAATAAMGTYTAAATAATRANTLLAASGRAAAGALALVGGPLGAAVIAGGALFYFREELGLIPKPVQSATDRIDDMTSALDANSEAALKNAKAMLEAERQFQQFRQATLAMDVTRQRQIVADEQRQWDAVGGQQAFGMGQRSEAQQALHELQVELMNTRNAIDAAGGSVTEIDEKLAQLEKTTRETVTPTTVLTEETEKLTKAQRDAIREAEQFANSLQSLTDRLYPVEAAQRQYREEQELLTLALAKGEIGVVRYLDALGKLEAAQRSAQPASTVYNQGFGAEIGSRGGVGSPTDPLASIGNQDYWDKWLQSAETALTDFDQLAANTAENFQRGFGNAFESMVFDSENTSDALRGMAEGIARSTVNALGQMAGQWLAYQAVQLAVGKTAQIGAATALTANAQAGVFQAGINAFSSTAAIPIVGPAMAPAAMAAAIGATQPLATAVSSAALAGMAHDGIGSIPREGTWLLDKGERVLSNPQADRLDAYLNRQERGGNKTTNSYQISVDARGSSNPAETRRQARLGAEEAIRQTQRDFERNGPLRRTLNV